MQEAAKKTKIKIISPHRRLLEIYRCKINRVIFDDTKFESINPNKYLSYRVDEIPYDQVKIEPNEFLLPLIHFEKNCYRTFGVPFLIKVKDVSVGTGDSFFWYLCWNSLSLFVVFQKESFVTVKEKIRKKLDVSDQEFKKVMVLVYFVLTADCFWFAFVAVFSSTSLLSLQTKSPTSPTRRNRSLKKTIPLSAVSALFLKDFLPTFNLLF